MTAAIRAARWRLPASWDALFPPSPPARVTWSGIVTCVLAVLAATALSLTRTTGPGAWDTTLMEDAALFLSDELTMGPVEALLSSYSGYFHTLPRLLAILAALFPPSLAAAVLATEAALVTALLALFVYVASAGHFPHRLQRALVSAPMVALPLAQAEMPNAVAMLRWPLIYAVFWAIVWVPPSRSGRILATALVVLAAVSDNVVWIFIPLVLLRVWRDGWVLRGGAHRWPALVQASALGLGLLADLVVVITGASERGVAPRLDPLWATASFVLRPVPQIVLGSRWVTENPADSIRSLVFVALGWAIVVAVVVVAWRRVTRPQWLLAVVAGICALAIYLFCTMVVGVAGPRYGAPPAMLVLTALVALLTPGTRPGAGTGGHRPLAALAALLAVVCAVNLRMDGERTNGPSWSNELAAARRVCATADAAGTASTAEIAVSPVHYGWKARLPCTYLLH